MESLKTDLAKLGIATDDKEELGRLKKKQAELIPFTPHYWVRSGLSMLRTGLAYFGLTSAAFMLGIELMAISTYALVTGNPPWTPATLLQPQLLAAGLVAVSIAGASIQLWYWNCDNNTMIAFPAQWRDVTFTHLLEPARAAPTSLQRVCAQALELEGAALIREHLTQVQVPTHPLQKWPGPLECGAHELWLITRGKEREYLCVLNTQRRHAGNIVPLHLVG